MRLAWFRRSAVHGSLLIGLIPLGLAPAQDVPRKSEIRGVVLRSDDRLPVIGAQVSLEGTDLVAATDSKGRFKFPKVAAGRYLVRAEIVGFPAATTEVRVERGERMEVEFLVGATPPNQVLPGIEVTERARERVSPIVAFNRRATEGRGHYITREVIERRNPATMMDLLRTVPGAEILCPRTQSVCVLRFRRFRCDPAYFLDGVPADPSVLFLMVPRDVEGVELYSGSSQTPIELEGPRSGCGVVAFWTRIGERPPQP